MQLAARTARIAVSPTMKVAADAMQPKAQGVDVVDFGAGEPDFPTPPHISAAAHRAIDANFPKYTVNSGTDDLKRAIVERYKADNGVEYAISEVIVSAGGKQALFNSVLSLFGAGDEVITHMPGWPTLVEQIKLAEATPVIVRTHGEDGFRLRAEDIFDAFTPRTRGLILNSPDNPTGALIAQEDVEAAPPRPRARTPTPPDNPTGALIAEEDVEAIAREAAARGIWILVDLCYDK